MYLFRNPQSALHHIGCRAALNLILNYAEFRTNPEPYVVRGMVQGAICHLPSAIVTAPKRLSIWINSHRGRPTTLV